MRNYICKWEESALPYRKIPVISVEGGKSQTEQSLLQAGPLLDAKIKSGQKFEEKQDICKKYLLQYIYYKGKSSQWRKLAGTALTKWSSNKVLSTS